MTEHLPECPVEAMLAKGHTVAAQSCICERLRACEKRVLNAAREAVAALTAGRKRMDYEDGPEVYGAHNAYIDCVRDALAAIKGDQQ